jgi:hypothetical protein
VSVKSNIAACVPYYAQAITNYPGVNVWLNTAEFLSVIGLPSTALSESPYFRTQQLDVTGGWHHVYAMLTNLNTSYVVTDPYFEADHAIAWIGEGGSSNNLTEAYSSAESDWHNDDFYFGYPSAYTLVYTNANPTYYAAISRTMALVDYASNSAGFARNVIVWIDPGAYDPGAFNGHNDFTNDSPIVITNISENKIGFTVQYGNTNFSFDSSVCVDSNHSSTIGWVYYDAYVISDWSTPTNGFKYK